MRAVIPVTLAGMRSDQALASVFPEYSRTTLKSWILAGRVQVDGRCVAPRHVVSGGEAVELAPPPPSATLSIFGREHPEAIPIEVIHEDPEIRVVNKPAGLVVHPGAGNRERDDAECAPAPRPRPRRTAPGRDRPPAGQGHLRLAGHRPQPAGPSKPGRPDQGPPDHPRVPGIVSGAMVAGGSVEAAIGRHPVHRTRMAVVERGGKPALTHYRVIRRFRLHTQVRITLETGRTHQIRVHMAHVHYPLVGDPMYGARVRLPRGAAPALAQALREFPRQALHAARLALEHPATGATLSFAAPLPADMEALIALLTEDGSGRGRSMHGPADKTKRRGRRRSLGRVRAARVAGAGDHRGAHDHTPGRA